MAAVVQVIKHKGKDKMCMTGCSHELQQLYAKKVMKKCTSLHNVIEQRTQLHAAKEKRLCVSKLLCTL